MRLAGRTRCVALVALFTPLAAGAWAQTDCSAMSDAVPAGVTIAEAVVTPAGEEAPVDHCLVRGAMEERTGSDGRPYALMFKLRLPDDWSGRFLHQFNGGNDGRVVPALGARDE